MSVHCMLNILRNDHNQIKKLETKITGGLNIIDKSPNLGVKVWI